MIYLDYQATTPLAPEAREAMLPWLGGPETEGFANPHSPHRPGRAAKAAVELAREQVMRMLLLRPSLEDAAGDIAFTSGATEALNWALKGSAAKGSRPKAIAFATDHAATLDTMAWLERQGVESLILPVGSDGRIDEQAAIAALDDRTAFVVVTGINNEIGTIQNGHRLSERARALGVCMILDAVQQVGRLAVPLESYDLVAISAHKIHGPKGIGALWMRRGFAPEPLIHGGGQEAGLRSGTLSPALCAGFGAAAHVAVERMDEDWRHVLALHDRARALFRDADWHVNGSRLTRYPGNLNLRRDGVDAGRLISEVRRVAFSAGSACASGSGRPSHVLRAIGLTDAQARASIRLGFGRYTTTAEIDEAAALINAAAARQLEWA